MEKKSENQKKSNPDIDKLKILLPYWINHNNQHIQENEKWLKKIDGSGFKEVADELKKVIERFKEANSHIETACKKLKEDKHLKIDEKPEIEGNLSDIRNRDKFKKYEKFTLRQIGVIHTPYSENAPYQPVEDDEGDFCISVDPRYTNGLYRLESFEYVYVIYYIHRIKRMVSEIVNPPWAGNMDVGVFASRTPVRPNPIGLSIVKIKKITDNEIHTSGLDVFDGTPLLDIKPYIKDLDSKEDANYGWIKDINDFDHLLLHIKGIPHDY